MATLSDWYSETDPLRLMTYIRGLHKRDHRPVVQYTAAAFYRLAFPDTWCVSLADQLDAGFPWTRRDEQRAAENLTPEQRDHPYIRGSILPAVTSTYYDAIDSLRAMFSAAMISPYRQIGEIIVRELFACQAVREIIRPPSKFGGGDGRTRARLVKSCFTSDVLAIARNAWIARDFSSLPILADALQDAGCQWDDMLAHLRGDGPHFRGCWALRAILGSLQISEAVSGP